MQGFLDEFLSIVWRIDVIVPLIGIIMGTILLIFALAAILEALGFIGREKPSDPESPWSKWKRGQMEDPAFIPILQEEKDMIEDESVVAQEGNGPKKSKKKVGLLLVGAYTQISKFRKDFATKFSKEDKDVYSFVADTKGADIVITIIVERISERNTRLTRFRFQCSGWIAQDAAAFGDKEIEYLLMSYHDDEKELFNRAAQDIAGSLLEEYKAVKPAEETP